MPALRDASFWLSLRNKLRNVKGSHYQFVKGAGRLTIPHPKKDLPLGTARAIARVAGWIERSEK